MRIFVTFIIFFLITGIIIGQTGKTETIMRPSGFEVFVEVPALEKKINSYPAYSVLEYVRGTRSDAAGSFRVPVDELFIALPEGTRHNFTFTAVEQNEMRGMIPALNDKYVRTSDSTFSIIDANTINPALPSQEASFQVVNYFKYRSFYCARVRVPLVSYSPAENSTSELRKYKITISFESTIPTDSPSPSILTTLDSIFLQNLANREIALRFLSVASLKTHADSSGNWINYTSKYIKIGVAEDRIYRLSYQTMQLTGAALPANPESFRMYYRGKEIPVSVSTQQPGIFGAGDYIDFFGQKNYEPESPRNVNPDSLPYNNYLNKFSDTSYYFLTWGSGNGLRASVISGLPFPADTLSHYNDFIHFESNTVYQQLTDDLIKSQDPEKLAEKAWFGAFVHPGSTRYTVSLSNIVRQKTASVYARLSSGASNRIQNAHSVTLGMKVFPSVSADTLLYPIESKTMNRFQRVVLGGSFPSDSLKNGNNVITIRNYANGTEPNYLLFDWYELEYPRVLRAINDSLYFEIRDSISTAVRTIKIINSSLPTDSVVLYRVKPVFAKIATLIKNGSNLFFADTVGTGYAYYLYPIKKLAPPQYLRQKQFVNLRSASRTAEYIGITHPNLFNAARNYLGFIRQSYSVDTALISVDDIYDEFAYGNPDPSSIRAFLAAANANWLTPKPQYLILLGSASYDYKRYVFKATGREINPNLVPSFGEPVSDTWFTMWDESAPRIQQMFVGRLPSKSESELNYYLEKHRAHLVQRYDAWNKRALFFSGGSGDSTALNALKAVNANIITNYVVPPPFSLAYDHFYKTVYPLSDFGPFEPLYIRRSIENGGLFISYLGHSGTRTWDNSIADPNQLLNRSNKGSLISDFGCSTAKFAEADIESFGGLFVNGGQALAYVGNTSFGFSGTSYTAPTYFYEGILRDSLTRVSETHLRTKLKLFSLFGSSGDVRVFSLTNTLLGDPILQIALPVRPNLTVSSSGLNLDNPSPNERDDSVRLRIRVENIGSVINDSFVVQLRTKFITAGKDSTLTYERTMRVPAVMDTLTFAIPVKNTAGEYKISVTLDPANKIRELYEDDNAAETKFSVASLSLKIIANDFFGGQSAPSIKVLLPAAPRNTGLPQIVAQYDTSSGFSTATQFTVPSDTFFTKIPFTNLQAGRHYFVRVRLAGADTLWSNVASLYKSAISAPFLIDDHFTFEKMQASNLYFDNGIRLAKDSVFLTVKSGGGNYSKYGSILRNNINVLNSTFGWGMGMAVIDPVTLKIDSANVFQYGFDNTIVRELARLIDQIPDGKIVCMNVIDDGYLSNSWRDTLYNALKKIGASKVTSLSFRQPWLIVGRKGAAPGTVPEFKESASYQGILTYDTVLVKNNGEGSFTTPILSNAGIWKEIQLDAVIPGGTSVRTGLFAVKADGTFDSLGLLAFSNGKASLSMLNNPQYYGAKFTLSFSPGADGTSPVLKSFAVFYDGLAELEANSRATFISPDTLQLGGVGTLAVAVSNAGHIDADSVHVLITEEPGSTIVGTHTMTRVSAESTQRFSVPYSVGTSSNDRSLQISVDPLKRIREYYKENNQFIVPVPLSIDSSGKHEVSLTFDGAQVYDGEFVPSNPKIKIEVSDFSLFPLDSNYAKNNVAFKLFLDKNQIQYGNPALNFTFSASNPKVIATYSPELSEGNHTLQVIALSGNLKDTISIKKTFTVKNDLAISSLYNYPNPFAELTNFVFDIPVLPDECTIKVFTVAGRLVRSIVVPGNSLRVGFNKGVTWDAKDENGDEVANGVYLYRIILKKDSKTVSNLQKLVLMR